MRWVMSALHLLMMALFGLSAAVQYNDPDPLLWMVIYTGAALLSLQAAARQHRLNIAWAWGVGCLAASAWLFQTQRAQFAPSVDNEVFRELGGLLIISLWMAVIVAQNAVMVRRMRADQTAPVGEQ